MTNKYLLYKTILTTTWLNKEKEEVLLEHSILLSNNIATRFKEDESTPDDFIELKKAVEEAKRSIYTSKNLHFQNAEISALVTSHEVELPLLKGNELKLEEFENQFKTAEISNHYVLENRKFICDVKLKS